MKLPDTPPTRLARAALLARSGLVDAAYYEAQTGRAFASDLDIARHYLAGGSAAGHSLHPLFEAEYLERERPSASEDPAVRYLRNRSWRDKRSPHPLFHLAVARRPWLDWVRNAKPDTAVPVPDGYPPVRWGELRDFLIDCALEWRATREESPIPPRPIRPVPLPDRPAPSVSVVVLADRPEQLRPLVESVLHQHYPNLEALVVDDGSHPDTSAVVAGIAAFHPSVRTVATTGDGIAAALNAAIGAAGGEYLAFAAPGLRWDAGFLADMIGAMLSRGSRFAYAATAPNALGAVVTAAELVAELGGADASLPGAAVSDFQLGLSELEPPLPVATPAIALVGDCEPVGLETQPAGWLACVQAKRLLDWSTPRGRPVAEGTTSVVLPILVDLPSAIGWIGLTTTKPELELVLVGLRTRGQYCALRAAARGRRVVVRSVATNAWSLLCNLGAAVASGERLVFVKPGTELKADAITAVSRALDDPGVAVIQPLNVRIDLTISTAGAYFAPGATVPSAMLAGHPLSDGERLAPAAIPAAYSAVVGIRAADFIELHGFDPAFANSLAEVDLSLRAAERGLGRTELVPALVTGRSQADAGFPHDLACSARVLRRRWSAPPRGSDDCLANAGFSVVGHSPMALTGTGSTTSPVHTCLPELAPIRTGSAGVPSLRWAIDIAAPATWWGERWGDRYFALSLAAALRRLGQQVAVDHREARGRETRKFEDVVLTLRGIDPVAAVPGPLNLIWVLSHPDEIGREEAAGYDLVLAASAAWAAERSRAWGFPVEPLLQCTDTEFFRPDRAVPDSGAPVIFVGNARQGGSRPVVDFALAAGITPAIYGSDWEHTPAASLVVTRIVPNTEIAPLYAGAGIVLNDHWSDMARHGFISNRLFDAVACGARVLSDRVDGIGELFGDSVRCYEDPSDLARLLREPPDANWPALDERQRLAERVRQEHSFDRRAEYLLAAALRVRERRARQGLTRAVD